MIEESGEQELRARQDGRVYPLGRALRTVFDADNHASLGSDLTGLMIDLSKLPYPGEGGRPLAAQPDALPRPASRHQPHANRRPSVMARLAALLGQR